MIDEKQLERLARLESDAGIVSAYLRLDPRLMYDRGLAVTKLKSAFERFERRESSKEKKEAARRERRRIESFLNDWTPSGRAIAFFACEPADIWEVIPLSVSLPTLMTVDNTTNTRPLALLLDEFPRILVCVVQRDKATLYVSEQREGTVADSLASEVPGRHSAGGWSQARFGRHTEFHVEKHLQEVVSALEEIDKKEPFDRLILGGTTETTSETERLLPDSIRSRLVASVPVDVKHESEDEILERAREASGKAERKEEEELVGTISERTNAGGRGVLGLDETLRALVDGRIEKMVLIEDLEAPGWECTGCDYVALTELDQCPVCGSEVEAVANIVDVAVERAFLNGAKVDFIFDGPAKNQLEKQGNIGALLRY